MGGGVEREMGGSNAGTEAGGDCTASSVADGITLTRLTPDWSPARFANQLTARTGDGGSSGGSQQQRAAADGQCDRVRSAACGQQPAACSQREAAAGGGVLSIPPVSGNRTAGGDRHRAASKRAQAGAGASGSRRSARKHPGGGHGREGEWSEGGGPRVGFPALRESTGDCGAAAPLARAGALSPL